MCELVKDHYIDLVSQKLNSNQQRLLNSGHLNYNEVFEICIFFNISKFYRIHHCTKQGQRLSIKRNLRV